MRWPWYRKGAKPGVRHRFRGGEILDLLTGRKYRCQRCKNCGLEVPWVEGMTLYPASWHSERCPVFDAGVQAAAAPDTHVEPAEVG